MSDEKSKLIIDEDWKSQVEAEKEAATSPQDSADVASADVASSAEPASAEAPSAGDPNDPPMPPASFAMLISTLATEAMMALGQMPHPVTGEVTPRRNQAKYIIDTIEMLHESTQGNVPADETEGVGQLLHQLRMAYVGMSTPPATPAPPVE